VSASRTCSRLLPDGTQCRAPGTWLPELLLRVWSGHEPARLTMRLPVCARHREELKLEDLMCDECWEHVQREFAALGLGLPRAALTEVSWVWADDFEHLFINRL